MSKENLVVPLDKLLIRYKKDRQWLSILCGTDYREMTKLLESKATTYGDLQRLLEKGGISLEISIQNEIPPYKNTKRMQFMEYNLQLHKANATYIANRIRSGAPKSWFDNDDIPLIDLVMYEKVIDNSKLQFVFNGMNGVEDIMNTAVTKKKVDYKRISDNCLMRFRKAYEALDKSEGGVKDELKTEAVTTDMFDYLREKHLATAMELQESKPEAELPGIDSVQEDPAPETEPAKRDPWMTMNVTMVESKMEETGFSRELAGALVYDTLIKDKLTDEENKSYLTASTRIDKTIDFLCTHYWWMMDILHKKGHRDRDIFSITKTNWCAVVENLSEGQSIKFSELSEILLKANRGLSLRFMSDPKLEPRYRDLHTGFIQKWINVNDPDRTRFPGSVIKTIFDYDDYWVSDETLRYLCEKTGESLSLCIFDLSNPIIRPTSEMAAINPPKKTEKTEKVEKTEKAAPVADTHKKTKTVTPKKTARKPASPNPDITSWLKAQEEYDALRDRIGMAARMLDGRFGEDSVNAVIRFDAGENLQFAILSRRLKKACRAGELQTVPGTEPDFDTRMLISSNRSFLSRLDIIDEIHSTLRRCFGHTIVTFRTPVPTQTGKTAVSLSLNNDDGLNIQTEDKGFLKKKVGTYTADDPHALADLFSTENWYAIVKAVKQHYETYGLAEMRRRVQGTFDNCAQSATAYEAAIRGVRNSTVALVAEAQETGFLTDFSEIVGDALFSSPSIEGGHAWFHRMMDSTDDRVSDEQLPVETLLSLNALLADTIRKKLYPKDK